MASLRLEQLFLSTHFLPRFSHPAMDVRVDRRWGVGGVCSPNSQSKSQEFSM